MYENFELFILINRNSTITLVSLSTPLISSTRDSHTHTHTHNTGSEGYRFVIGRMIEIPGQLLGALFSYYRAAGLKKEKRNAR